MFCSPEYRSSINYCRWTDQPRTNPRGRKADADIPGSQIKIFAVHENIQAKMS